MPEPVAPATGPEVTTPVVDDAPDAGEITPPESKEWWKFADKAEAEAWGNKLVTNRLTRERKTNLDPVVAERDTLKAEVEELRPLKLANQTDAERRDAEFAVITAQNLELSTFKAERVRTDLVRDIAEELDLPARFIPRIVGKTDEEIRTDITDLLNVLSEGGQNTKQAPKSKAPKETEAKKTETLLSGGGGADEEDLSAEQIMAELDKRRGNSAFQLR